MMSNQLVKPRQPQVQESRMTNENASISLQKELTSWVDSFGTENPVIKKAENMAELFLMPKKQRIMKLQESKYRRPIIFLALSFKMSKKQTISWISEMTGLKKTQALVDEINFFHRQNRTNGIMDAFKPLAELKELEKQNQKSRDSQEKDSEVENDQNGNGGHSTKFVKNLYSALLKKEEKSVEKLTIEVGHQVIRVSVQIDGVERKEHFKNEGELEDSLIDILTFLELCHEQNASIKTLALLLNKTERSSDFFKMFVGHDVVGKVNIDNLFVMTEKISVPDALKLAKYTKCKELFITMSYFEYGSADKFVEAMRNCNSDLRKCHIITKDYDLPNYLCCWKRFDDFDVTTSPSELIFTKCTRQNVEKVQESQTNQEK